MTDRSVKTHAARTGKWKCNTHTHQHRQTHFKQLNFQVHNTGRYSRKRSKEGYTHTHTRTHTCRHTHTSPLKLPAFLCVLRRTPRHTFTEALFWTSTAAGDSLSLCALCWSEDDIAVLLSSSSTTSCHANTLQLNNFHCPNGKETTWLLSFGDLVIGWWVTRRGREWIHSWTGCDSVAGIDRLSQHTHTVLKNNKL